jgi:hypothetical protein
MVCYLYALILQEVLSLPRVSQEAREDFANDDVRFIFDSQIWV